MAMNRAEVRAYVLSFLRAELVRKGGGPIFVSSWLEAEDMGLRPIDLGGALRALANGAAAPDIEVVPWSDRTWRVRGR
jgi:hypothetical protein